jgi:predicted secreted hydrolase
MKQPLFRMKPILAGWLLSQLVAVLASPATIPTHTSDGFRVPQPGTELSFPSAHGSHPDYKIEWWYLTGHLFTEDGKNRFGFQATFFRTGIRPPGDGDRSGLPLDRDTLFLGHMALTDVTGGKFHSEERFARGGWDAYAREGDTDVRMQNWTFRRTGGDEDVFELVFTTQPGATVQLQLRPTKPLVRFGADGTSRKGAHPEARSFYLTFPRLECSGTVAIDGKAVDVRGEAWMDHEIASRQLDRELAGWDWTAIHLHDGWDLKAYILRREDGSADAYSRLYWISPDGVVTERGPEAFEWERLQWWQSEATGATYPIGVAITTEDPRTGATVRLELRPLLPDQELRAMSAGFPYWEGAGIVINGKGQEVGNSYLELVGYGGIGDGLR